MTWSSVRVLTGITSASASQGQVLVDGSILLNPNLHRNKLLRINSISNIALTLDASGWITGDYIDIYIEGVGGADISPINGVVVDKRVDYINPEQGEIFRLQCLGDAKWVQN